MCKKLSKSLVNLIRLILMEINKWRNNTRTPTLLLLEKGCAHRTNLRNLVISRKNSLRMTIMNITIPNGNLARGATLRWREIIIFQKFININSNLMMKTFLRLRLCKFSLRFIYSWPRTITKSSRKIFTISRSTLDNLLIRLNYRLT